MQNPFIHNTLGYKFFEAVRDQTQPRTAKHVFNKCRQGFGRQDLANQILRRDAGFIATCRDRVRSCYSAIRSHSAPRMKLTRKCLLDKSRTPNAGTLQETDNGKGDTQNPDRLVEDIVAHREA